MSAPLGYSRLALGLAVAHEQNMPDTATVERLDLVPRPAGGYDETWVEERVLKCRLNVLTAEEVVAAAQLVPDAKFKLAVPAGTDLDAPDDAKERRITVRGHYPDGRSWEQVVTPGRPEGPRSTEVVRYITCGGA